MYNLFFVNKIIKSFKNFTELEKIIIFSIISGVAIVGILITEISDERFSSLYIYPDSYTNYPEGDTVSFIYGFKSNETERTSYDLKFFLDSKLINEKHFELDQGEVHEEKETLDISGVIFPAKVRLVLKSPSNTYETHYWIKKFIEETPAPLPTYLLTPVPTLSPNVTSTPAPTPTADIIRVRLDHLRGFYPEYNQIKVGDSVVWTNDDIREEKFTLVSKEGLFEQFLNFDKKFKYTFDVPGNYTFYLKEFPGVKGKIDVS